MEGEISTKLHRQKQEGKNGLLASKTNDVPAVVHQFKRKFTWGQCLKYELNPEEVINKTAELPKSCTDIAMKGSPIQEFYSGTHVLVTGATGFMGKIIVEKLLVSCPKLERMYLIIREKRGKTMDERFDALFEEHIFKRLRETVPGFRKKVVAVPGDCSLPRLGMSDKDYNALTSKINVIIHGAATVRFDEKIRIATHINVRGVKEMLKFCSKCTSLKSIVHISTAYANSVPDIPQVDEKFYEPAYDYNKLIDLVETHSDEALDKMLPSLISPWPNTYAFTKQIAENVIKKEATNLPIAIFRPAVVVASAKEPLRSWSDNIYGPTGVVVGAGTGVLRVMHGNAENTANLVPVDMTVNGLIAASMKAYHDFQEKRGPTIYNYVSSYRNAINWDEFAKWSGIYGRKYPTMQCIWYPMFHIIRSRFLFLLLNFVAHTIPAYLADTVLFLTGNKPILIKAYKKIGKFCDVLAYFATRDWRFPDDNVRKLWESMTPEDKLLYPFDIAELDWDLYSHTHLIGLRVHILKDKIDTIEPARIKYKRLLAQHIALLMLLTLLFLWLFSRMIGWSFF